MRKAVFSSPSLEEFGPPPILRAPLCLDPVTEACSSLNQQHRFQRDDSERDDKVWKRPGNEECADKSSMSTRIPTNENKKRRIGS